MASRKDLELWVVLTNPVEARHYVEHFNWNLPRHLCPTEITLDSGRKIDFLTMSDDEAVVAAQALLRDVEIPLIMNQKQFEEEH